MKAVTMISLVAEDLRNAAMIARKSGFVASFGDPRDIDGDESRWAMTVMLKIDVSEFRDYIARAWRHSIRVA